VSQRQAALERELQQKTGSMGNYDCSSSPVGGTDKAIAALQALKQFEG
jgi:hypothetical protein